MPSEHSPADQTSRDSFPRLQRDYGEDPARWLDAPWDERQEMIRGRIRGIDDVAVARAWMAVERRLGRGEDAGPREHIIERLQERLDELEDDGGRPDDDRLRAVRDAVRADHPEWGELDPVERPSRRAPRGPTPGTDRYQRDDESTEQTEASGLGDFAVATDGGDSE